jgi:hypothetical protein
VDKHHGTGGVTGARFGPLEIYARCDQYECGAEGLMWLEGRDPSPPSPDAVPDGWSARDGKTYCPGHSP